jgi:hypothetical protein
MRIQDSRIRIKRSTTASEVPTVPTSDDHTDGTWLVTDIYKGEFFKNLVDGKLFTRFDSGITEIAVTPSNFWNISGNTLTQRQKFGSISGAYGWDNYVNNSIVSGVGNTGKHYWGTNGAFTDTDFSYKGSGNTSATYNSQWKNSDNLVLAQFNNLGDISFGSSLPSFSSGGAPHFYDVSPASKTLNVRFDDYTDSDVTFAVQKVDGDRIIFGQISKSYNEHQPIIFSNLSNGALTFGGYPYTEKRYGFYLHPYGTDYGADEEFMIADGRHAIDTGFALSSYAAIYASTNNQFRLGGLKLLKENATDGDGKSYFKITLNNGSVEFDPFKITSGGNIGFNGSSFGSGAGVMFIANAGTDASANPTGGAILQSKSGRLKVYETDGSLSWLVKAASSTKTTAGAPYTNDGYIELIIDGNTYKVMTTA